VHLLDTTNIRVGNDEYARDNKSFGLTTMRERHVEVDGSHITFRFRGKSGKMHDVELTDPRAARVLKRCEELPGQELFQYVDGEGEVVDIDSDDVNGYIQDVSGGDFTAKDFRTWSGTVLAAWALQELGEFDSKTQAKRQVVAAVKSVSEELGNTPAVCRPPNSTARSWRSAGTRCTANRCEETAIRYVRFALDRQTSIRAGFMLACVANPTRQPSRRSPWQAVTMCSGMLPPAATRSTSVNSVTCAGRSASRTAAPRP
jgi:hypothetical protein